MVLGEGVLGGRGSTGSASRGMHCAVGVQLLPGEWVCVLGDSVPAAGLRAMCCAAAQVYVEAQRCASPSVHGACEGLDMLSAVLPGCCGHLRRAPGIVGMHVYVRSPQLPPAGRLGAHGSSARAVPAASSGLGAVYCMQQHRCMESYTGWETAPRAGQDRTAHVGRLTYVAVG
jgi:hypothetical protein